MNDVAERIQELMAYVNQYKKEAGVDKKAANKVVARLEEAWLWAGHLVKLDSLDNPANMGSLASTVAADCTCFPGIIDRDCPVHGGQVA